MSINIIPNHYKNQPRTIRASAFAYSMMATISVTRESML